MNKLKLIFTNLEQDSMWNVVANRIYSQYGLEFAGDCSLTHIVYQGLNDYSAVIADIQANYPSITTEVI